MNKKTMLLALAAVSAVVMALPALASAQTAHLDKLPAAASGITGGGGGLTRHNENEAITCTSVAGQAPWTSTTGGTMNLLFHGCKNHLGLNCTSAGQPAGTISAPNLRFDLIMFAANKPAILLTPPAGAPQTTPGKGLFADFTCFGVTVEVFGNGIIGTIDTPVCGAESETATVTFKQTANGTQDDRLYTGVNYDLESQIGAGGAHVTSAINMPGAVTVELKEKRKLVCT